MKQLIYETKKGTILFVKIEKSYSLAGLNDGHIYFWTSTLSQAMNDYPLCFEIPKGDFELIGLTSEVTEEQAKMMVHSIGLTKFKRYKNYVTDNWLVTSLESFKSLMQHLKVYEVNPISPDLHDVEGLNYDAWKANQSMVGKWIVLFKSNEKL